MNLFVQLLQSELVIALIASIALAVVAELFQRLHVSKNGDPVALAKKRLEAHFWSAMLFLLSFALSFNIAQIYRLQRNVETLGGVFHPITE